MAYACFCVSGCYELMQDSALPPASRPAALRT